MNLTLKIKSALLVCFFLSIGKEAFSANELNLPPNELGKVMVLMYHRIGGPESTWSRTPQKFREDLEMLYKKGYYLINLIDLVEGKINVPKGKTPVVLTFDDTAAGQINFINETWDPECAVGMINEIFQRHPDFGRAGSFYLNPKNENKTENAFLKEALPAMVKLGYELGNHTVTHPHLNVLSQEKVEKEIAGVQEWVEKLVPGYSLKTMAMPHGIFPKDINWAKEGTYNGVSYHMKAFLKVGADAAVSPYSSRFNSLAIPRLRASEKFDRPSDGRMYYMIGNIEAFDKNPSLRFISDGDPSTVTVPAKRAKELHQNVKKYFEVIVN